MSLPLRQTSQLIWSLSQTIVCSRGIIHTPVACVSGKQVFVCDYWSILSFLGQTGSDGRWWEDLGLDTTVAWQWRQRWGVWMGGNWRTWTWRESDNLRMEAEVVCGRREMGFRSLKGEEHLLLGGERSCYVWAGFWMSFWKTWTESWDAEYKA